MFIAFIDF